METGDRNKLLLPYGLAILAAALATAARLAVNPILHEKIPYATFFFAILVAAWYGGFGPAIAATLCGAAASMAFFLPTRGGWVEGLEHQGGFALYLLVGLGISLLGGRMSTARRRAEDRAADATKERARLELEMEQRKRAEAAKQEAQHRLQRQQEQFRVTLASIGDAVVATDPQGKVTFLNPVAQKLTGWTQAEAEGTPLAKVFRIINEHTRKEVESPVEKVLRDGEIVGLANHTILIAKGGEERAIDDSAAPIRDEDGALLGVVLVFRDVTERNRAEQERRHLAAIVESSHDAIIGKSLDGVILSWNSGAERLYGYAAEEIVGKPASLLVPQDRADELAEILDRLRRGEPLDHYDTVRLRKDGARIDVSARISPICDAAGAIVGASVIARDVTERKRSEKRRNARLAITQILAHASGLSEAAPGILQTVCESLDWDAGAFWIVDPKAQMIRCAQAWQSSSLGSEEFVAETRRRTFGPGRSLPGRAWQSEAPVWILDVTKDPAFVRSDVAARQGLHGGFACPVKLGAEVLGVIEFFSRELRTPDDDLLEMLTTLGGQMGQFIERKRAEEALRESERQFRELADAMPQIVWSVRPDGVVDYFNQRWHEFVGADAQAGEEGDWSGAVHPDDWAPAQRQWRQALQSGSPFQMELRLKDRPTGGYRWHLARSVPIKGAAGEIVRWYGTSTDIDEQKRAAETSRFLANASAALAELVDDQSALQIVARLAVPFFADWCSVDMLDAGGSLRRVAVAHVDPSKVALANELHRRHPPNPAAPTGVWQILRTGRSEIVPEISEELLEASVADHDLRSILRELGLKSYMGVPLQVREKTLGVITFIAAESGRRYDERDLAAAEDLAHRAAIAIENAQLYAEARDADQRKDQFLATLAHELRGPLAPIRNSVQVMRLRDLGDPQVQWARDVIDRQAQQLTRLVDDLLDISRISRGKVELRKKMVDLASVVERAVETTRPAIDEREQDLQVALPESPVSLEADAARLAQVFANLLSNAAKYTDRGGRIWLDAERQGSDVVVRVRDTGIGIAKEDLPRIFEIFSQVAPAQERSQGGLGIGLSLVKGLVEMHCGSVQARSEGPGKGSEFIVRLPIRIASSPEMPGDASAAAVAAAQAPNRILVVDDNADAATTLALMLGLMGHEVEIAHDGLAAVEAAARFRPEVTLLDIGLPKLNGYDACRRIRQQPGGDKIVMIALTGWGQESDRRRAIEAGFDHHFTKPINAEALAPLLPRSSLAS